MVVVQLSVPPPLASYAMADSTATVRSLMECYQLKERDCNQQISNVHLDEISLNFSQKWRFLPNRLKMKDIIAHDIDRIPGDEEEKRRTFFLKWKQVKGSGATYKVLIRALLDIKCRQDAESVCKLLQQAAQAASDAPPARLVSPRALTQTNWWKWLFLGKLQVMYESQFSRKSTLKEYDSFVYCVHKYDHMMPC